MVKEIKLHKFRIIIGHMLHFIAGSLALLVARIFDSRYCLPEACLVDIYTCWLQSLFIQLCQKRNCNQYLHGYVYG